MITFTINGREIKAEEGMMVLDAARDNNIYIPALCVNEAVEPYGACRLCMVEITTARGRQRLVASCLYPVEEGLTVRTDSERIAHVRKTVIELLLARCPDSEVIQDMARQLGVEELPFRTEEGNRKCILCALCARTCQEVVGVSAISLASRGVTRQLSTPFYEPSEACIGCGSCAYVCPTGAIEMEDTGDTRAVRWPHSQMEFKMRKCKVCGSYWIPERQIEHITRLAGISPEDFDVCYSCR
ncbi:MAG: 2Fe-2S iron-sulfur cluster-binding protein [Dehalococcoidales bacterium]|nr:2Fe-2S iron-sulfur cluster-binding protein [Dehalococcoidales bacterium]